MINNKMLHHDTDYEPKYVSHCFIGLDVKHRIKCVTAIYKVMQSDQ